MNIRWVQSPCKDCPDRHITCHSSCDKYKEYKKRHYEEKDRMYLEDKTARQIHEINKHGAETHERPVPLKHGYKTKRR